MKRFLVAALAVTLMMVGLAAPAAAQEVEWRTAGVMTMRSYQNFLDDVHFFGGVAGLDEALKRNQGDRYVSKVMPGMVQSLLEAPQFDAANFPGLDKSRPLGGVLLTDGLTVVPVAFLPIADSAQFIESAKQILGSTIYEEAGDNVYEMGKELTYFVKVDGQWAFIVQSEQNLGYLPDPAQVVGNLPELYDTTVQLNMQEFPRVFADMILDMLARDGAVSLPGAPAMGASGPLGEIQAYLLAGMLNDIEQITIGMSLDEDASIALVETTLVPIEGSVAERHFAEMKGGNSAFGTAVNPESLALGQLLMTLDEGQIERLHQLINSYENSVLAGLENSADVESDEERQVLRELLTEFISVARSTADSGNIDMLVQFVPGDIGGTKATLAMASRVADGEKLDAALQRIAELGKGDPGLKKSAASVAEHQGVAIHGFQLAAAPADMPFVNLLGAEPTVLVAYANDKVYLTSGDDALAEMQKLIEGEENAVPPAQSIMDVRPMLSVLTSSLEGDMGKMAANLGQMYLNAGDPTVRTSVTQIDGNKLKIRTEGGDGLLKLGAVVAPLASQELIKVLKSSGLPLPF